MTAPAFPGALAVLARETDAVRAELARIDAKANTLLAFTLGWLTAIVALAAAGPRTTMLGAVALWTAGLVLVLVAAVLLWSVRPRLPRTGGTGFVAHARAHDGAELLTALAAQGNGALEAAGNLHLLSTIALAKNGLIRLAVDLMLADLVLLAVTLPLLLVGRAA
ncbi:Pycsar system effector family protein [Nonomuraea sp. AD125B]|uniref:Pycsar system effector family protein n=1 Tax=Nonomuraea sp. AD125B TaxID=3242897 RepID=UPI0035278713